VAEEPNEIATAIVTRLAHAWNTGNGAAWGAEFTAAADFVNIFGVQMRGQREIEKRHQYLFDALFAGSTAEFLVVDARALAPNVILAHSTSVAKIPEGSMTGEQQGRQTLVIVRDAGTWRLAALQNTLIKPQL
jgi:uncharacterized protein (TIGR02246 family)